MTEMAAARCLCLPIWQASTHRRPAAGWRLAAASTAARQRAMPDPAPPAPAPSSAPVAAPASPRTTLVVGASGGIGRALVDLAEARGERVLRLSRPEIDAMRPETFLAAADALDGPLDRVIVATGLLHRDGRMPERDLRMLDPEWLVETYVANAVAPAMAARAFLPKLAREGCAVFAVLTARVGSIGDNRLGGWHGYRMAKAAANQLVKTLAVEMARKNPRACLVALHPGTVDTGMSKPFQRNLKPGQLVTAQVAAANLTRVMDALTPADSGRFLAWDGSPIPW